jgi:hypothetical protein
MEVTDMPIRAILKMKETPLPLAVDLYSNVFAAEAEAESSDTYNKLIEGLEYDFRMNNNPEKCPFTDWSKNRNELYFTKGYMAIFDNPLDGVWIAYESLKMLFECNPSYRTGDLKVFYYAGKRFWVKSEITGQVIFLTPDEY